LTVDRRGALKAAGAGAAGIALMGLPQAAQASSLGFNATSGSYSAGATATIEYRFDIQNVSAMFRNGAEREVWLDFHRTSYIPSGTAMTVTVDWGDGSSPVTVNSTTSATRFSATKTYATTGVRTVTVSAATPGIGIGYGESNSWNAVGTEMLTDILSWSNIGSLAGAFIGGTNLVSVPNYLPTGVKNIESCFRNCTSFNAPINNWDTTYVTTMVKCFNGASTFNQNVGSWTTGNVTNMWAMFQAATVFNNGGSDTIKNWDTSKVTNMWQTFAQNNAFNQPIGSWNVGAVTNMYGMFLSAVAFNQPLGSWNTGSVTNMGAMFSHSTSSPKMAFDQDISTWNVSSVTSNSGYVTNNATYYQSTWTSAERPTGFPSF
jgi:surface protein